jgi:predicted membrane GTPase involved in stress response
LTLKKGQCLKLNSYLSKALQLELKPIVVINKIDKPAARIKEVENELSDLFLELAVHEDQLHYPVYYAIGRDSKAWKDIPENPDEEADLSVIFESITKDVSARKLTKMVHYNCSFHHFVTILFKENMLLGVLNVEDLKKGTK